MGAGSLRVLVVDDSVVFRSQIKSALEAAPAIEVVGVANNGKIALQKLAQLSVDLVTLDLEMPEMNGLETLKEIRKAKFPVRVIVFSSRTSRGSEAALEALARGADDFVTKPAGEDSGLQSVGERIQSELLPKVKQFLVRAETREPLAKAAAASIGGGFPARDLGTIFPSAIVIGSSTGGPPALEKALTGISVPARVPIFIAQHMPPVFTTSLARRLSQATGIPAAEGQAGEVVQPNRIYVAPGDYHMTLKKAGQEVVIELDHGPARNSVRPAVDPLFETAAAVYGARCLGVVLTGMGEDGMLGARAIKNAGGAVMIQDKESCVVFGMPGAVFAAGAFDGMGDLPAIQTLLKRVTT